MRRHRVIEFDVRTPFCVCDNVVKMLINAKRSLCWRREVGAFPPKFFLHTES